MPTAFNSATIEIGGRRAVQEVPMILCDLCGQAKECLLKEIEGREYDICNGCWNELAAKLAGKGRTKKEIVLLPSPEPVKQNPEIKSPRTPPKIWGGTTPN